MNDNNNQDQHFSSNLWIVVLLILVGIGTPSTYELAERISTKSTISSQLVFIIGYGGLILLSGLATAVFKVLFDLWGKRIADYIDHTLMFIISRQKRKYLRSLFHTYKFLDIKSISSYKDYYFRIGKVFTNLDFAWRHDHNGIGEEDITNLLGFLYTKDDSNDMPKKVVIIAGPGSGKTTLIKYLTHIFAGNMLKFFKNNNLPQKYPILIILRNSSETQNGSLITNPSDDSSISLPQLVHNICLRDFELKISEKWIGKELEKGNFIVLIDGLDEVRDNRGREEVVSWVQRQMNIYPTCSFIITSRPHGYEEHTLDGVYLLQIKDLNQDRIREFVHNWYCENEVQKSRDDNEFVRKSANKKAEDLLGRLNLNVDLSRMAKNPLLLTMMLELHSQDLNLPGKRVELFADMIEVNIKRGILRYPNSVVNKLMRNDQQIAVLEDIAYRMMETGEEGVLRISRDDLLWAIGQQLKNVSPKVGDSDFLQSMVAEVGIILEAERGVYEFAHKSFQEYLASAYVVHQNKRKDIEWDIEEKLLDRINVKAWGETIRLYSAQTDATSIVNKILEKNEPNVTELGLAIDLLIEAQSISKGSRDELNKLLNTMAESGDEQRRGLVGQAKLNSRIGLMVRFDADTELDNSLISNIEYQLFVNYYLARKIYYMPDHWAGNDYRFEKGADPVYGIRREDALAFCHWMSETFDLDIHNTYSIPRREHISENSDAKSFWAYNPSSDSYYIYQPEKTTDTFLRESINQLLDQDLLTLGRIVTAIKYENRERPNISQLLAKPYVPGYGSYESGQTRGSVSLPWEKESEEIQNRKYLWHRYQRAADLVHIDFNSFLDLAYSYFYPTTETKINHFHWLKSHIIHGVENFDLSARIDTVQAFFEKNDVNSKLDVNRQKIIYFMDNGFDVLRNRKWQYSEGKGLTTSLQRYEFIRWFIRVCLLYLLSSTSNVIRENIQYLELQGSIIENSSKLLYDMLVLEKRIQGFDSAFEGLRIVKLVRH